MCPSIAAQHTVMGLARARACNGTGGGHNGYRRPHPPPRLRNPYSVITIACPPPDIFLIPCCGLLPVIPHKAADMAILPCLNLTRSTSIVPLDKAANGRCCDLGVIGLAGSPVASLQRLSRGAGRLRRATTRGSTAKRRVGVRLRRSSNWIACPLRAAIVLCRDELVYVAPRLQNRQYTLLYYITAVGPCKSPNVAGGASVVVEVWRL